jgi:tetratricopeptide (TPR) repeat protein
MDPREMDTLVQRLVQNPHDQEAITYAHHAGQSDPRSYAMLLEKVGTATSDPAFASHWLTEAANVWTTTLGDAHRAARALMIAIDRDPTQPTPAERLADLYREKGDTKALVALLERRAKALAPLAHQDPELRAHVAGIHEELGRLWAEPPLAQNKKAIDNYRRAIEYDPSSQYAIYAVRELLKTAGLWAEAIPYFAMEQALVGDTDRRLALYQDESEVRRTAGDLAGAAEALRSARSVEGGRDPAIKQQFASLVLERAQSGESVGDAERSEAAQLFVELSEEFPGEHGLSYSACAIELEPANDRAIQLAMYYSAQLGREAEAAPSAAAYLKANPGGALAGDARALVSRAMQSDNVDDSMLEALAPAQGASNPERARALLEMAEALARKGKKNDAAAKYQEVVEIDPANPEAVGFLESHLRQTRKYAELKEMLLKASRAPGVDVEARRGWLREIAGLCETQLRDLDTAIAAWQQLFALDRSDEGPKNQLRRLLERAGRWDDLATLLEQEAEQTTDIEARISMEKALAKIHEQKRKDPVATGEAWARIANLSPDDESAIQLAVRNFERGERLDLAAQVIADNLANISDERSRGQFYKKLGELRHASGDLPSAGQAFAEGATLIRDPALWESAEQCFVQAAIWDQAANAVDERARLAPKPRDQATLFATEAEYLGRAGDDTSAVLRLEQATDLDPENDEYAGSLEERYTNSDRTGDLAQYLLRRAEKLSDKGVRIALRKRAAFLQRDALSDGEAARESLRLVLTEADDPEALSFLADDAEQRTDFEEAVGYLRRLGKVTTERDKKTEVLLREARLFAEGLDDGDGAIERYETILKEVDPKSLSALAAIADLHEKVGNAGGTADALERELKIIEEPEARLEVAERLATLYEGPLDDPKAAVRTLDIVHELDPTDFDAVQRLCDLCERLEDWPRVAEHAAALIEVEGDEAEISRMTRRLATILHEKVQKGDEALAALMGVADRGDEPCREDYVRLGDELGWKGIVATKLVEWYLESPGGEARNQALRGAFDRFLEVGRDAEAAMVAKELARTRGASGDMARRLEEVAVKLKDLDALGVAHDLLVEDLSGPARAEEMVRQAEVLVQAGVSPEEAIQHGEQALTSVPPGEVEPLLERLGQLAPEPGGMIDLYERQVTRCKAPADRLNALARAAQVAAERGAPERARSFFDLALAGGAQDDTLSLLEDAAKSADEAHGGDQVRRILADSLASGGQGSRDGGRTRSALLRRAADIAYRDLNDEEKAFQWLGDALVTHVDDEGLDALEGLATEVGEPRRAETVLGRALEEVFDGPLVRKLLARRAELRRDRLDDKTGAATDLKRLHDLSPADTAVMDQLSALYTELGDYRGMVQLYEDQILRGKDPSHRAELARKVARLWEEKLEDAREAADAWRRVLRMKSGDPEATEGLERAKSNMLKKPPPKEEPEDDPPPPPPEPSLNTTVDAAPPSGPSPEDDAAAEDEERPTNPPPTSSAGAGAADDAVDALVGLKPVRPELDFGNKDEVTQPDRVEQMAANAPPPEVAPMATTAEMPDPPPRSVPPPPPSRTGHPPARSVPPPPPSRTGHPPPRSAPPPSSSQRPAAPAAHAYNDRHPDATEVRAPAAMSPATEEAVPVDEDELLVDEDELIED